MKHNMGFSKTGKCFICGGNTKSLIHQECGKKADADRKKTKKVKAYSPAYLRNLSNL